MSQPVNAAGAQVKDESSSPLMAPVLPAAPSSEKVEPHDYETACTMLSDCRRELATANHWLEQMRGANVELLAAQSAKGKGDSSDG